jgi:glycosyltransferase involved in cell wall biosynthesis
MYEGRTVVVVVPAHNEELLVASTVATIPSFVDRIFVVDDASRDQTVERALAADKRVEIISHERNEGVGAAIVTGYRRAIEEEIDVTCVMAADGQMDPSDLEQLVSAVALGECDYAKANRLFTGQAWHVIPRTRYLGNAVLSFLTKIASGYWHIADSQSGYTAINLETLRELDLGRLYRRYGFPNDILVHLNVWGRSVSDYPSRPIYGNGERSGLKVRRVIPRISWLLAKGFFWRLWHKYVIRDFHPLVLFYVLGLGLFTGGIALGLVETVLRIAGNEIPFATVVLVALFVISGIQLLLFAMWFDMETNKDLHARKLTVGRFQQRLSPADLELFEAAMAQLAFLRADPRFAATRRQAAEQQPQVPAA